MSHANNSFIFLDSEELAGECNGTSTIFLIDFFLSKCYYLAKSVNLSLSKLKFNFILLLSLISDLADISIYPLNFEIFISCLTSF